MHRSRKVCLADERIGVQGAEYLSQFGLRFHLKSLGLFELP